MWLLKATGDPEVATRINSFEMAFRMQAVAPELVSAPCLTPGQATALGRMLRKAEDVIGVPVEIEWAMDEAGFKLLQARPLHIEPAHVPDEIWLKHPGLNGHPAGVGWGSGRTVGSLVASAALLIALSAPSGFAAPRLKHHRQRTRPGTVRRILKIPRGDFRWAQTGREGG